MLNGLDLASPIVQQLIKNNPVLAQQLGITPTLLPTPSVPAAGVTMEQVQDAITERLKGFTHPAPVDAPAGRLGAVVRKVDAMLQRALPVDAIADLRAYADAGAPARWTGGAGSDLFQRVIGAVTGRKGGALFVGSLSEPDKKSCIWSI